VVPLSGSRIAEATVVQHVVTLRQFYEYLIRANLRSDPINPVVRGGGRRTDREFAQLLFVHRGKGMGLTFLNRRLIPLLCQKAGVDPRDAEGAYTAHRGRSARISMLHACGLELEDLAAYAIHKNSQTIKKYARRNPIHLHRRVARADTLSTVIEGLYDPGAAARGAPLVRWFLGYDADGAPQFCGLPAHHTCPHRRDCSRCGLFIGGERARLVHDDPNLLRVTSEVPCQRSF